MTLPKDVAEALDVIAEDAACVCSEAYTSRGMKDPACNHDLADSVEIIRAELLRLTRENVEQRNGAVLLAQTYAAAEAELAKLRARIEAAPEATLSHGNGDFLIAVSDEDPDDWAGESVRLLVENDDG